MPTQRIQKSGVHAKHRAWAIELVRSTGLPPSRVATGAGLSDTTLSRLVNDDDYTGTLSPVTIARLVEHYKVPPPDQFQPGASLIASTADAVPIAQDETMAAIIATLGNKRDKIEPYTLQTRALDALGYMPGDVVFVDTGPTPQPGDVVLAETRDGGTTDRIFRLYEPPYLIAASLTPGNRRPLLVDNVRVIVCGTVIGSARLGKRE